MTANESCCSWEAGCARARKGLICCSSLPTSTGAAQILALPKGGTICHLSVKQMLRPETPSWGGY